ncbi:MAG: dehydrogenase [Rhizobiales bacterium]|nr:dehydrogenase [Hyphomicrobiales bacterium]MBI3671890.1 dehydrogenase [Hyphomicrobiales bacterium]
MTAKFRVALSSDFKKTDGSPTFPDFDLAPLMAAPNVEVAFLEDTNPMLSPKFKSAAPLQAAQLEDFDALILLIHRFAPESVPKSGRLAAVARFGVGYDTVDVPACTAGDIALCITPDGVRRPVAVSILTFMLALTGKMMVKDRLARLGPEGFAVKGQHMGVGLVGKTLGSLGVGNIGAEMFRLARPFDMKFIAHDPFADPKLAAELGIELVGIEDLFARADILTVNCPLTPDTHHIVNAGRLALMKKTAYLINTARGPIVDQKALTEVLADRRIAGAGLDVFEVEPTDPNDPLHKLDNVIVAPHAMSWTDQCFAGVGAADIRAVLDIQHGRSPRGVVNREVLERPGFKRKLEGYAKQFA